MQFIHPHVLTLAVLVGTGLLTFGSSTRRTPRGQIAVRQPIAALGPLPPSLPAD